MKDLFIAITDKLATVAALRWVDADEGQLDFYETRPAVAFPCALVDIDYQSCRDLGEKVQLVDATITIRFAFEPLGQTNTTAPVAVKNRALARFETIEAVFDALQGWDSEGFGDFSRTSQTTEKRDDNLKVVRQVWATSFEEAVTE